MITETGSSGAGEGGGFGGAGTQSIQIVGRDCSRENRQSGAVRWKLRWEFPGSVAFVIGMCGWENCGVAVGMWCWVWAEQYVEDRCSDGQRHG